VAGLFCHYHDPEVVADSSQYAASDSPRRQEK
jgi:hypothetical protein